MYIKIVKIRDVNTPIRGYSTDAGLDLYIPNDFKKVILKPNDGILIPSGIKIEIPYGYAGIFLNKSSIGMKGLIVAGQVIDTFYSGEVHIDLHNISNNDITLIPGMKIAQILLIPVLYLQPLIVDENDLYKTMKENRYREGNGFGSTEKRKIDE